ALASLAGRTLLPPAHQHITQAAKRVEDRAFVFAAARARVGQYTAGEARKWQRLQPDFARTGERGQEQSFAAEDCILEAADKANVVSDARLQGDEAAGVELDHLAGSEHFFNERA